LSTSPATPAASFSSAALDEWTLHLEAILRGVGHSLNNRAAALSAAIQLAADPADAAGVIGAILEPELRRVTDVANAVRAIGAPRAGDEAFSPADAAAEARGILLLHAEQRERGFSIDVQAVAPVRTKRWMFVRALVVLGARGPDSRVAVSDDGEWIVVRATGGAGAAAGGVYVRELAVAMGGAALDDGPGFRLPTLAALRQREGR
jgi:hypothetical protein